ncbi:hypothetical protein RHS01_11403 [Rhizoctonia solani]|uniref:Uncharacterized protein n=1 Tax=Rhizoctonia solani TaxID=456999 RepID=A0A8H7I1N9_9AGAM|nr:hypothetical protein RHS01_11403 [Rhizoctonia solani]
MQLGPPCLALVSTAPNSKVVEHIYNASHAGRDAGTKDFSSLLAQVAAGSSDSKVQARRTGALESNAAGNAMVVDPLGSDSGDKNGSNGESETMSTLGAPAGKELTLSGDKSEVSGNKTNGEGVGGLVSTSQHPGNVYMRTDNGTRSRDEDNKEDDKEEEDNEEEDNEEEEEEEEEEEAED